MTLTQAQRDELRRLAQAATPGPWEYNRYSELVVSTEGDEIATCPRGRYLTKTEVKANAAYIAAAHPQAVLELLDALAAAEQAATRYLEQRNHFRAENAKLGDALDEAEKELASLKRHRWMHSCDIPGCVSCNNPDETEAARTALGEDK